MKSLRSILLVLLALSALSSATVMKNFCDSVPVGRWVQFPSPTLTQDMVNSLPSGTCYAYGQQALWDSLSDKLYFMGSAHGSSNTKAILYDAATNEWRNGHTPREPNTSANRTGHTYDHLTLIPDSGIIYYATYAAYVTPANYFYRYSFSTGLWDSLVQPMAPTGGSDTNPSGNYVYAGSMEFFPDINSLTLYSHDYGNYNSAILDMSQSVWSWKVLGGNAAQIGFFHSIQDYNPLSRTMLILSEMGSQVINAQKTLRRINQPPFSGSSYETKVACEPVTATHLAAWVDGAQTVCNLYAYNAADDYWQIVDADNRSLLSGGAQVEAVIFKIDEYGVIGMLRGNSPHCLIYKYAPVSDSLPIASLSVISNLNSIEEFQTARLTVVANRQNGNQDTVTKSCFFRTLDSSHATVGSGGLIKTVLQGVARIEVVKSTKKSFVRDTISLTVTASTAAMDAIVGSPTQSFLQVGDSLNLHATVYFHSLGVPMILNADSLVHWTSLEPSKITMSGTNAKAVAVDSSVGLVASFRGVFDTIWITVTTRPLSSGKTVNSSSTLENSNWGRNRLVDDLIFGDSGSLGFSSSNHAGANVKDWVEIDFGSDTACTQVVLFPRNDQTGTNISGCANFPVNFKLTVRTAAGATTEVYSVVGLPNPGFLPVVISFPRTTGRFVRLASTKLGTPASDDVTAYRLQLAEMQVFDDGPVSVEKDKGSLSPSTVGLNAVPNPFNPSTTVWYSLGGYHKGVLNIYNIKGALVRSFTVNAPQGELRWDGKEASGLEVASGTYLARLETASRSVMIRLLLMK